MKFKRLASLFIVVLAILSVFAVTSIGANASSIPQTPENFSVENGSDTVTLYWDTVADVDGYKIAIVDDEGNYSTYTWTSNTYVTFDVEYLQTYTFAIRSYDKSSGSTIHSEYSDTITFVTAPYAAQNVSAIDISQTAAQVSWSEVDGATGYEVYYCLGSQSSYTLYADVADTSVLVDGLETGFSYNFKVRAYYTDENGYTCYAEYSDVATASTYLDQTTDVNIEIVDGTQVNVSWSEVVGATGYQVWVKSATSSSFTRYDSTTTTSMQITCDGTTQVKVRAYSRASDNSLSYGDYSSESVVVGMVSNFAVTAGATSATFTWDEVTGVDGYKVAVLGEDGTWSTLGYTTKTSLTVNLSSLETYTVSIRAYEKATTSSTVHSDYSDSITFATTPAQVGTVKYSNLELTSVDLSWSEVAGATGYQIYYAVGTSNSYSRFDSTTELSFSLQELNANTTYKFKVRAYYRAEDGTLSFGEYSNTIIEVTTGLSQTTGVSLEIVEGTTVNVSWSEVSGATGYQVWVKSASSSSFTRYDSTTTTSMQITCDGTTQVKVRAYYRDENSSVSYGDYSSESVVVGMVSNFAVTAGATSATFTWDSLAGADGYKVAVLGEDGTWSTLGYTTKTSLTVNLSSLETYTVSIRAYEKATTSSTVHSDYSDSITFATTPTQVGTVKYSNLELTSVDLSWSEVAGATGYQIYYAVGTSTSYSRFDSTTELSFSLDGLTENTTYKFKVRAYYRAEDGTLSFGEYSNTIIEIKTTLSQVLNLTTEQTDSENVTISWDAVADATGYQVWIKEAGDTSFTRLITVSGTSTVAQLDETTEIQIRAYYRLSSGSIVYGDYSDSTVYVGMVTNFKVSAGSKSATFTWNAVAGASGYKIAYLNDDGNWVTLTYTTNTSITVALADYTSYTVSIRAYEKSISSTTVHSDYSDAITFLTAPAQVQNLEYSDLEFKSVVLSWDEVDGATGYQIYMMKKSTDTSFSWYGSTTDLSYLVESLTGNSTYYFKVRAYYRAADGTVSFGAYADVTIEIFTTLSQTLNLTAADVEDTSEAATKILSWDAVPWATGYEVWVKTADSSYYELYAKTSSNTATIDFKLYQNTDASIKVRAYYTLVSGSEVYGSFSSAATVSIGTNTVKNITADDITNYTIDLSWTSASSADGYRVYYRVNGSSTWSTKTLSGVDTTSYTITGLTMNTEYEIAVKAYFRDENGDVAAWSDSSYVYITTTKVTTSITVADDEVSIYDNESYAVSVSFAPSGVTSSFTIVPQDYTYTYKDSYFDSILGDLFYTTVTVTFEWEDYYEVIDGVIYAIQPTIIPDYDGENSDAGEYFTFEVVVKSDDSGVETTFELTIEQNPLQISSSSTTWYKGMTTKLTAKLDDSDYITPSYVWTSSNTDIATVDSNGNVTFVGSGYVEITASTTDGKYTNTIGQYVYS